MMPKWQRYGHGPDDDLSQRYHQPMRVFTLVKEDMTKVRPYDPVCEYDIAPREVEAER